MAVLDFFEAMPTYEQDGPTTRLAPLVGKADTHTINDGVYAMVGCSRLRALMPPRRCFVEAF
jgi:hypothetical protein